MLGYEVPSLNKKKFTNLKKSTFEIKNLSTNYKDPFLVDLIDINLQIKKVKLWV